MFIKMTPEDWQAVIETNLNSMFNVTKQVVGDMVEKGWGRIINISSVNGAKGQAGQTNYSAAKAGDRKSTRLNSSHLVISYAVFCLKKKKIPRNSTAYTLKQI